MRFSTNQIKRSCCIFLLCFIAACAKPGHDPNEKVTTNSGADDSKKDQKDDHQDLNFSSAYLTADTTQAIPALGCRKALTRSQFPKTPDQLSVDANLTEWSDAQLVFASGEIASTNFDMGNVYAGINDHVFAVASVLNRPLSSNVYIELGGVRVNNGIVMLERNLTLRTDGHDVQEFTENQQWSSISSSLFSVSASDKSLEVAVSRRYVGEAVNWPIWWFRIYDEKSPTQPLNSSARFFKKLLDSGTDEINLTSCEDWGGRSSGQIFFDEIDFYSDRNPNTTLDKSQKDAALQAIRAGFSAISNLPLVIKKSRVQILLTPFAIDQTKFLDHQGKSPFPFFSLDPKTTFAERPFAQQRIFVDALKNGLANMIRLKEPEANNMVLSSVMTESILPYLIKAYIGEKYFYENFFETFGTPEATPAKSVGYFLSELFPLKDLFSTLDSLLKESNVIDLNTLINTLTTYKPERVTDVSEIFNGWLNSAGYSPKYAPVMLTDPDGDGLLTFTELQRGLNPNSQDTDQDGWSDFSEIIFKSDPKTYGITPSRIIADGDFSDFLTLMPKLIHFDQNFNSSCPKSLDITHFAALYYKNIVTIGAATAGSGASDPNSYWEVSIVDQRTHRQFVLRHSVGSRSYTIQENGTVKNFQIKMNAPSATSGSGAEWQIDLNWLGLPALTNVQSDTVELQIRNFILTDGVAQACDETNSFLPVNAAGIQ